MNRTACTNALPRCCPVAAIVALLVPLAVAASDFEVAFKNPPSSAKPWVFWHWVDGAASRKGISADLAAMQRVGLGGAHLLTIGEPADPPVFKPPALQLTDEWWEMIRHTAGEADRLGLQLALHACDGFAVAGGPWITPELSMQQVVWTATTVEGGRDLDLVLPAGQANEGFYRDIAILAFPALPGSDAADGRLPVAALSSHGDDVLRLSKPGNNDRFRSAEPCHLTFTFAEPFTCRTITICPDGRNYQSQRLRFEASADGVKYWPVVQLTPPRHGWQDGDRPVAHAVPTTDCAALPVCVRP